MTYDEFLNNFLDKFEEIKTFAGKIKFANENLTRIGSGTGRAVYDIDGEKVLKLAKNNKGIAQNAEESSIGKDNYAKHIVTNVFESADDDSWIIAEKAKKVNEKRIKELTGIPSLTQLSFFLKDYAIQNKGKNKIFNLDKDIEEQFYENEFSSDLIGLIANYNQSAGDMGRPSSYGEVIHDGQPAIVLTDYGLSDEVYDSHYNPNRRQRVSIYELYNFADGNDDILSNADNGEEVRKGMWALMPYGVGDGEEVVNEEFISFVLNRDKYPTRELPSTPYILDKFHECVNNLKETLNRVDDKKKFYNNLLELQDHLIKGKFYDREPLLKEEVEFPPVKKGSLTDEIAVSVVNQFTKKLGLPNATIIKGGANGVAFRLGSDKILKITADVCEIDAAQKTQRTNPKTLVAVDSIYKVFDSVLNQTFYILIEEFIDTTKKEEIIRAIQDADAIIPDFTANLWYLFRKGGGEGVFAGKTINDVPEIAKQLLTANPESGIDNNRRQNAYNIIMGLYAIKSDLINLDIKSNDYDNPDNLGYKDGILTYYDIGACRVPEPPFKADQMIVLPENEEMSLDEENSINEGIDKNFADRVANEIAKKYNYGTPNYIRSGTFGVAYEIDGDKVLKVTTDKSEAMENLDLIGKPLKYIAEPYHVYEIKSKSNPHEYSDIYVIILEKLKTDDEKFQSAYERINFAFDKIMEIKLGDVLDYYVHGYDTGVDEEKLKKYFSKNPKDEWYFNGLLKIAEEAMKYGIESMDYINPNNLGYKKDGSMGFFDVGFGNYFAKSSVKPTEVEMDEDGSSIYSTIDSNGGDNFPAYDQNDTSPMIDNNIPANTSMYNEDLEYNHVTDATQDEYIMTEERLKTFMPKSSSVEVKKKCKLGGLGNTSVACNQGDIDNLELNPISELFEDYTNEIVDILKKKELNEFGEATATAYPYVLNIDDEIWKQYTFDTGDNDIYFCSFKIGVDGVWRVDFGYHNKEKNIKYDFNTVLNKGKMFKVMATLIKILLEFIKKYNPDIIKFTPKTEYLGDDRRKNLYIAFLKKNLPSNYIIEDTPDWVYIKKKNNSDNNDNQTNEATDVSGTYGQQAFHLKPEFDDFERKYNIEQNVGNKEEVLRLNGEDVSDVVLLKNPKSLDNVDINARGIIDPEGNLYIEVETYLVHSRLVQLLKSNGLINDQFNWHRSIPKEFVTVIRDGDTNDIYLGESNEAMIPSRDDHKYWNSIPKFEDAEPVFQQFLDRAKQKNPNINFVNKLISHENYLDENVNINLPNELDGYQSFEIKDNGQIVGELGIIDRGIWGKNHYITIDKILIEKEFRGKGFANQAMEILFDYADKNNIIIALTPDSLWGSNKAKLTKWYKSLGFIMNQGKKKDYYTMQLMYRLPKNIKIKEGVADKYAEKEFNIPDDTKSNDVKASGEVQKTIEKPVAEIYDDAYNEKVGIYKNPKSLANFDQDVRAIADSEGDLYIAQTDGNFNHGRIAEELGLVTYSSNLYYYLEDYVLLHRLNQTNEFALSDTAHDYMSRNNENLERTKEILSATKKKNPNYEFFAEYFRNTNPETSLKIEGVGDKFLYNKFGIRDDAEDIANKQTNIENKEEIININNGDDSYDLIKNPKTLNNIDSFVRGLIDTDGNMYLEFIVQNIHDKIIKDLGKLGYIKPVRWTTTMPEEFITIRRVGNTNKFVVGESTQGMYPYEWRNIKSGYWDSIPSREETQKVVQVFLDKAKIKNPNYEFINDVNSQDTTKHEIGVDESLDETAGELDKQYMRTGVFDNEDRDVIMSITNGDAWTKLIADMYYYLGERYQDKDGEWHIKPKKLNQNELQVLEESYEFLKRYDKNVLPIHDLFAKEHNAHPLEKWQDLRTREAIISRLRKFPSILLRNLKNEIRKERQHWEFETLFQTVKEIQGALELLEKVKPEKKEIIYKKIFSSNNDTFDAIKKRLEDTTLPYLSQDEDLPDMKDKVSDMGDDAEILYSRNNVLVVEIRSSEAMKYLGCSSQWCFASESGNYYWVEYAEENRFPIIVYNFNEEPSDPKRMVVVLPAGDVYTMYNEPMKDGYEYLQELGISDIVFKYEPEYEEELDEGNFINKIIHEEVQKISPVWLKQMWDMLPERHRINNLHKKWYKKALEGTISEKEWLHLSYLLKNGDSMYTKGILTTKNESLDEAQLMSLQDLPFKKKVEELGGKIFSVGGAVRDEFLGKESKDLDILITGIPMDKLEQLLSEYGSVNAVGKSFGVLKFVPKGETEEIDIAIPRTETPTGGGGHKDFEITSNHDLPIESDLLRRDFTINAIAKDIDGNIIDPYNGQEDLQNEIIRVVNPEAFSDDPLRMLRGIQFASRFGFTIEPKTMQMIKDNAYRIKEIPAERILIELQKIVDKGDKLIGVDLLRKSGLFQQIFGRDIGINRADSWNQVKTMGEYIYLMTKDIVENPADFYLKNLKGDIDTNKEIKALQIAFNGNSETPVKARSVVHNMYLVSPKSLESQILPNNVKIAAQELLQGKYPKTTNELAVNGNDLIQSGLKGKEIGDALKMMLIKIYADKINNNKEELLALL